ncbi:MAG: hypothetical protein ACRDUA_06665, partial [Micromonosporaceae bacterium]
PAGYAAVCTLIAERCANSGLVPAAMATDSETNLVPLLLAAAGEPLAVGDAGTVAQFMSSEPSNGTEAQRRALALARALQAGTLAAVNQPAPRDLATLRPILIAHRAATAGRTASVGMLRDLLRELYPAALRAFPEPAVPLALAVLERLPDPTQVTQANDAELVAQLRQAGHAGAEAEAAIAGLRSAVAEMSTRRPPAEAVAATVRSGVATVRSSDSAATALVRVITTQVEPRTGGRGFSAVPPANRTASGAASVPSQPVSGAPVPGAPLAAAPVSGSPMPAPVSGSPMPPVPAQQTPGRPFGSTGAVPTQPGPSNGTPGLPSAHPPNPASSSPVSGAPLFTPSATRPPTFESQSLPIHSEAPHSRELPLQQGGGPTGQPPAPSSPAMMPPAPPPAAPTPSMMPPAPAPLPKRPTTSTPYGGTPSGFAPQVSPTSASWASSGGPHQQPTTEAAPSGPYGALSPPQGHVQPLSAPNGSTVPDQSDEELSLLTPDELPTSSPLDQPAEPGPAPSEPPSGRLGALIEFPRSARRNLREQLAPPYGEQERRDTEDEPTQEYRPPSPRRQAPVEAPASSPPLGENDGDLLIFAQARSAWFTGEPETDGREEDWRTEADAGWNAAEAASRPTVGGTTVSGLPRRVPSANLVPGTAPNRERASAHPINRDAAQLAAHTAGYFRGWNRARQDSQEPPSFPSVRHQ